MKFYVNIHDDGDGEDVISSVTDYPIIDEGSYTLFWDTDKYGWITDATLEDDLDDFISKNPSLLYNGYYEVRVVESIDEIDPDILKEIFGTSDSEEIKNNIDWQKLIQNSKDKLVFPKKELYVDGGDGYRCIDYTQYINAKDGELTYVGVSLRELLQFIKDNCYKG